mmetsp:Transcript_16510/g.36504  ORF Transcript_16510/g.36504 Transcript_16510/m.36504 type:complete len:220 (-) Transcript_16510:567-1226(-)
MLPGPPGSGATSIWLLPPDALSTLRGIKASVLLVLVARPRLHLSRLVHVAALSPVPSQGAPGCPRHPSVHPTQIQLLELPAASAAAAGHIFRYRHRPWLVAASEAAESAAAPGQPSAKAEGWRDRLLVGHLVPHGLAWHPWLQDRLHLQQRTEHENSELPTLPRWRLSIQQLLLRTIANSSHPPSDVHDSRRRPWSSSMASSHLPAIRSQDRSRAKGRR